ncbi:MAG: acyl carrier protein [bacterium]|nr:acyl carrier protein [bacterium]
MQTNTEHDIRVFIAKNFLFSDDFGTLDAECSLLETDIINSIGVLELVMFLEEHFNIKVKDAEVVPENLDSIKAMVAYLQDKSPNVDVRTNV